MTMKYCPVHGCDYKKDVSGWGASEKCPTHDEVLVLPALKRNAGPSVNRKLSPNAQEKATVTLAQISSTQAEPTAEPEEEEKEEKPAASPILRPRRPSDAPSRPSFKSSPRPSRMASLSSSSSSSSEPPPPGAGQALQGVWASRAAQSTSSSSSSSWASRVGSKPAPRPRAKKQAPAEPANAITYAGGKCKHCSGQQPKRFPLLRETMLTRGKAKEVVEYMWRRAHNPAVKKRVTKKSGKGFMVGILEISGVLYGSTSGSYGVEAGAIAAFKKCGVRLVDEHTLQVTARGTEIDLNTLEKKSSGEFFHCAAPKLIGYVLHVLEKKPKVWHMTEMWFGEDDPGGYVHGAPCRSCSNCRQILPQMICLN